MAGLAQPHWFALLDRYHYLGGGPLCGAQIRYVVKSGTHGYLGALAFSSAAWALAKRDVHIGRTEAARRANLSQLVGNDRFLILPTAKLPNLASHVLALAFTQDGTPLGVLDAQCWARDPNEPNKSDRRYELPIEQKESIKWLRSFYKVARVQALCPDTRLVSMGDRESDIHELFDAAYTTDHAPALLVRAERSRNRKTDRDFLWDAMAQMEIVYQL